MSRRRRESGRTPGPPRPRPERPPFARSRAKAIGRGSLVLAAVVAVSLSVLHRMRAPRPAADAVEHLTARDAMLEGTRLGAGGEYARSLPYLRRAVAAEPSSWEARFNLASSLANTALQVRTHLGRDEPVLRSSVERMAMLAEAERELGLALASARSAHERAMSLWARASLYQAWGLPQDALEAARQASEAEPGWPVPARLVASIEREFVDADRRP